MPIGNPIDARVLFRGPRKVAPVQIVNPFFRIIDPGALEAAQGTPIQDPDTDIFGDALANLFHIFNVSHWGTTLRLRMGYDRAVGVVTTDCILQVFGRFNSDEQWQKLTNKSGSLLVTMTIDFANDVDDGSTFQYTTMDPEDHSLDLDGCAQIIVGTNQILATDGDDSLAFIQARII